MNQKSKKNYEKRGNPYLRGKAWVYIYYELLPNGKKKQRYAGGFETKEAALLAMRARTPSLPVQIPPLKELLIEWFETVYRISVEPNTWNVYSIVLYRYILPNVEDDILLTELTSGDINRLLSKIQESGKKSYPLKTKELLSLFTCYAINERLLVKNPMTDVSVPKHPMRKPVILRKEQLPQFLSAARNLSGYLEVLLGLMLGLTKGEIYGLQFGDVDFIGHTIHIQRINIMDGGKPQTNILEIPKNRKLFLPQFLIDELQRRQEENQSIKREHFPHCEFNDYISMRKDGKPRAGSHLNAVLERITEALGWKTMTVQDLRENAIKLFDEAGVDQITVSAILGHVSLKTTLLHYRSILSANQNISNLFDERLGDMLGA